MNTICITYKHISLQNNHLNLCMCVGKSNWLLVFRKHVLDSGIKDFRYTNIIIVLSKFSVD